MPSKTKNPLTVSAKSPRRIPLRNFAVDIPKLISGLSECASSGAKALSGDPSSIAETIFNAINVIGAFSANDAVEQRLWKYLHRSSYKAIAEVTAELLETHGRYKNDIRHLLNSISKTANTISIAIDDTFWNKPLENEFFSTISAKYKEWLLAYGVRPIDATRAIERLETYYLNCLHNEWRDNAEYYEDIHKQTFTPFTAALQHERDWERYKTQLYRQIVTPIFGRDFGIRHIYVPLAGFYWKGPKRKEIRDKETAETHHSQRTIVDLGQHCEAWVNSATKDNAVLVLSGGPGSGKSSFAKVFAASVFQKNLARVLFIPLQRFSLSDRLIDAIGQYFRNTRFFNENPADPALNPQKGRILIIFDGLDELTKPGETAEAEAKRFFSELRTSLAQLNSQECQYLALVTGRTAIVQASRDALRANRDMEINLLKLYNNSYDENEVSDPNAILAKDLRPIWWEKYQTLTPEEPRDFPAIFLHEDLAELSAEPLLIFLLALSGFHKKAISPTHINRNSVYAELFEGIQARKYEDEPDSIRQILRDEFSEVIEAIATAAWYGDGRTATVDEVKDSCSGRLQSALDRVITSGGGVHKLIAAFYFQESEQEKNSSKAFEFTHKSFGEYLTSKRIVRELKEIHEGLSLRKDFFTASDAYKKWAALTSKQPLSSEVFRFVCDELLLQKKEDISEWRLSASEVFKYGIKQSPQESFKNARTLREMINQANNTDETMLAILSKCCQISGILEEFDWLDEKAAGKILSALNLFEYPVAFSAMKQSLSHLNLASQNFYTMNFYGANFSGSDLHNTSFFLSDVREANFTNSNLYQSDFSDAVIDAANFSSSRLENSVFSGARILQALDGYHTIFANSVASGAYFNHAQLIGADFSNANLENADFRGAKIQKAVFTGANLTGATFEHAQIRDAIFDDNVKLRKQLSTADNDTPHDHDFKFTDAFLESRY